MTSSGNRDRCVEQTINEQVQRDKKGRSPIAQFGYVQGWMGDAARIKVGGKESWGGRENWHVPRYMPTAAKTLRSWSTSLTLVPGKA